MKLKFIIQEGLYLRRGVIYFHLHQPCNKIIRKKLAVILTMLEFSASIVRKSEHRSLSLKPLLARRTSQEVVVSTRSPRLTAFWWSIGREPTAHRRFIDRGTHRIVDHSGADLLTRSLNDSCVFPLRHVASLFPLMSILSPIPLSGNNRERSILWLKHQDRFNICQQSLSFNFLFQLPFATRISSLVHSLIHSLCNLSIRRHWEVCWRLDDKRMTKGTRRKAKQDFEGEII